MLRTRGARALEALLAPGSAMPRALKAARGDSALRTDLLATKEGVLIRGIAGRVLPPRTSRPSRGWIVAASRPSQTLLWRPSSRR